MADSLDTCDGITPPAERGISLVPSLWMANTVFSYCAFYAPHYSNSKVRSAGHYVANTAGIRGTSRFVNVFLLSKKLSVGQNSTD